MSLQQRLNALDGSTDLGSTAESKLVIVFLCHVCHSVHIGPPILGIPLERSWRAEVPRAIPIN